MKLSWALAFCFYGPDTCPLVPSTRHTTVTFVSERSKLLATSLYFYYPKMMKEIEVVRALGALAHGVRLRVFRLLVVAGPSGLTPGALSETTGVPATTLSFHLKELFNADLITQERDGRRLICRASFEHMNGLLGYLTAHCCEGGACLDEIAVSCKC